MSDDPTVTNPSLYRTVFENERVRVLEYRDLPGDVTTPHRHPDSVMITCSDFSRLVSANGAEVEVNLRAGEARWVGAQEHVGQNTGQTPTHVFFVELKGPSQPADGVTLGPTNAA